MQFISGAIDSLTRWGVTGWAWLPDEPERPVEVEAILDGRIIGHAIADQLRSDLQGKRDGRCGFVITFADAVTSDSVPLLRAFCSQGSVRLSGDSWSSVAGYVDVVDQQGASGWAWMPDAPECSLEVEAVLNEMIIGRTTADQMRDDLAESGRGTGRYGFTVKFDACLADDVIPEFRVVQGNGVTLLRRTRVVTPVHDLPPVERANDSPTPRLAVEGAIDSLTRWGATGWAWLPEDPSQLMEIEAILDGRVIGHAMADEVRSDLKGKSKERCGFVLTFAEAVTSESIPLILARCPRGSGRLSGDQWSSVAGYVDVVAKWGAVGWAWMPGAPDRAIEVEAVLGDRIIGRALADQIRADIAASGRGTGRYGFKLRFDTQLADNTIPEFIVSQADGVTKLRSTRVLTQVHEPSPVGRLKEPTMSSLNVEGEVDSLTQWSATGWAWLPENPSQLVEVEAVLDGRVIGRTTADQVRLDRKEKGRERCGFVIAFTEPTIGTDVLPIVRVMGPEGPTVLAYNAAQPPLPAANPDERMRTVVEGAVDTLSNTEATGWAWMPDAPERAVEIEAILNGRVIGRTLAEQMRSDLLEHGKGTGLYGFGLPLEVRINRTSLPIINAITPQGAIRLPFPNSSQLLFEADPVEEAHTQRSGDAPHATPGSEGSIDILTRWYAAGWAWLPHVPNQSVQVEAVLQGAVIGRTTADQMRSDLLEHGKGTGRYGFKMQFGTPLIGEDIPEFRVLAATGASLPGALNLPPMTATDKIAVDRLSDGVGSRHTLLEEHARFTTRSPEFEEEDPTILNTTDISNSVLSIKPLLLAFYLPQFHQIPENDRFWGLGFTEWRQIARGIPRFPGHYQPRIPRDLGFYNLLSEASLKAQSELASSHGIGGFAYYYYWFNRKRVLEQPLELLLKSNIPQPFLLIWANENWTRTWDGSESDVLLAQDYKLEDDDALIEDLARHFLDPRYIRLNGRPLFIIYNPKNIPNSRDTILRWRKSIIKRVGTNPMIFMAQTFGEHDPNPHGLDGAMEFPPHKLTYHLPGRPTPDAYAPEFAGRVVAYDDLVNTSLDDDDPEYYPLIKTIVPSWDNDCRRPNRGLTLEGISPLKYQKWLAELISRAIERPIDGTPIVAINAWNEWAESAYLEPDVHFGAAFLNATTRALVSAINTRTLRQSEDSKRQRISVILPNFNHADFLIERINSIIDQTVLPDEIIFLDDCSTDDSVNVARSILEKTSIPYRVVLNEKNSGGVFRQWLKGISLASHDLIWIAETDDSADRHFLSNILPSFEREDVMIAFGRITCIGHDGTPRNDLASYFENLDEFSWNSSSIIPGFKAFSRDFAIKNVIPNASGAVFRKPILSDTEESNLFNYKFAGDWYFYILLCRGGAISYSRRARSYFRVRPESASRSLFFGDSHLAEHMMIIDALRVQYRVGDNVVALHSDALACHLPDRSPADVLKQLLNPPHEIDGSRAMRVCIVAHGFTIGGGEILPIHIANALKEQGIHVTYLVVERAKDADDNAVRRRLRVDIPVVYWDDVCSNFAKFIVDYGIEIVNSHNVSFDSRLFEACGHIQTSYIVSLHGGYETVGKLLTRDFLAFLSRSVSRWLYLSEKNLVFLPESSRDPDKLAHSFNAVAPYDGEWVERRAFRETHTIPADAFVFVLCSRAIEAKGWRTAIEVVESLTNCLRRPTHLVLIGDGPIAADLRAEYGAAPFVTFLGQIDRPIRYFPCFDMGLFPSVFEGETFPLFLLECFETGLPVIATDIGEIPRMMERIEGQCPGETVDHRASPRSLRAALVGRLQTMLTTSGAYEAYGKGARAASRRFSMEALSDFYCGVFRDCLSRGVSAEAVAQPRTPAAELKS